MGTCGSLSVLKCYPKSQQWPIQPPPFSNSSRRRWLRTQIRLGFNPEENDKKGSSRFEDFKDGFRRRRWWSEQDSTPPAQTTGILDQFIDNSYILKGLSYYGWGLPIMLCSLLIASGPKAFLMSMAFPIGESAITFTFKKLSSNPKTKTFKNKNKNRPQTKTANLDGKEEQGQNLSNFSGWD